MGPVDKRAPIIDDTDDDRDADRYHTSDPLLLTPSRLALIRSMAARAKPLPVKRVAH